MSAHVDQSSMISFGSKALDSVMAIRGDLLDVDQQVDRVVDIVATLDYALACRSTIALASDVTRALDAVNALKSENLRPDEELRWSSTLISTLLRTLVRDLSVIRNTTHDVELIKYLDNESVFSLLRGRYYAPESSLFEIAERELAWRRADELINNLERAHSRSAYLDHLRNVSRAVIFRFARDSIRALHCTYQLELCVDRIIEPLEMPDTEVIGISRRLTWRAAQIVPLDERARYEEEFMADLYHLSKNGASSREQLLFGIRIFTSSAHQRLIAILRRIRSTRVFGKVLKGVNLLWNLLTASSTQEPPQ